MILIKNLKLISKKDRELDRLTRFVKSEYNNGGQKILTNLFDAIIAYYPHYQFDRKEIYKKITGESGFEEMDKKKENLFNSYISQLNGIVEQFLMTEQLKTDHFLQQQLLAKAYLEKNDFSKFLKTNSSAKKRLPANQSDSERKLATLGLDLVFHPEYDNLKDKSLLLDTLLHTERGAIFEQLKIYAELFSISILVNNPIHLKKVTAFLKKSTKKEFLDFIPIKVYTQVLHFRIKNEAEKYLEILDLFESNFSIFSKAEQMQLFSLIQGFNIRNINNNQNCINQTYDFFNLGIKLNCFEMGKPISDTTFLNIANSKSMLYKFTVGNVQFGY